MPRGSLHMFVLLLCVAVPLKSNSVKYPNSRARACRSSVSVMENENYGSTVIERLAPADETGDLVFSMHGPGADEVPFGVFVIDHSTGDLRVTKVLDREEMSSYQLTVVAKWKHNGSVAFKYYMTLMVDDENDNAPVFGVIKPVDVDELSPEGAPITKITATDADLPRSRHSQIAFSIIDQNPPDDMFSITKDGFIYVKRSSLDREKADQYILTVKGQDLNGDPKGNTGTGTVTINVRDVNDHLPTLEKEQHDGSIEENTYGLEVMRLKALDKDQEGTPSWEAVFEIVKGNEAGYFNITTDPDTNEGVLMLDKPVDYADVKNFHLGLTVRNKAPVCNGSAGFNGKFKIRLRGNVWNPRLASGPC